MADVQVTKDLENKKLILNIVVNGPLSKVWPAYSQKDLFDQWWGPEGWTTSSKEFDFTPGGRIHYDMMCNDPAQTDWYGKHAWGLMVIENIEDGKSFTYKDYFSDENASVDANLPVLTITNVFSEVDGRTTIVSTAQADSAAQIEQLIKMGMVDGITSQINKLDRLVG